MTRPDHLYFIQCGEGGPIKIGVTHDPAQRFRTLQTACPYPLQFLYCRAFMDAPGYEARLHKMYARFRLNGEWFLPADDILRHIHQITSMDELDEQGEYVEDGYEDEDEEAGVE